MYGKYQPCHIASIIRLHQAKKRATAQIPRPEFTLKPDEEMDVEIKFKEPPLSGNSEPKLVYSGYIGINSVESYQKIPAVDAMYVPYFRHRF
jgi:hypothetical protein